MNIENWDDVDAALRRMGEIEIAKAKIDGEITLRINEIKEEGKSKVKGLEHERKSLEKAIEIFCQAHKEEFAKKRSRELNYGKIGFRIVRSVSLPRAKEKLSALLKALKAYGHPECIVYEEKPNKEKIVELPDEELVKLGLKRTVKDSFRIQPAIEKIEEAEA